MIGRGPSLLPGDRILALRHILDHILDRDLDRVLAHARARDRDLANELARNFSRARDLARELDRSPTDDLGFVRDLARDLIRDFDRDRVLARELAHILDYSLKAGRDRYLARDRNLIRSVARDFARARDRAIDLDRALADNRGVRRVAPSAAGLLAAVARLLPAADRSRYADEYLSELYDIAQSGAGRLQQLRYAFRQLQNVVPMSFVLRSPRRRSAVP